MSSSNEVEIKFRVGDVARLQQTLADEGFRQVTERTHEVNTLYDLPGHPLRDRGEVLRIRRYGDHWKLTHKSKGSTARHKSRQEIETAVDDGEKLAAIFSALGFVPSFRYEKYRAEWSDGVGHVVIDETPIGNLAEIEGPPEWIDDVAARLGVGHADYITDSYVALFFQWKQQTGSAAKDMTFAAIATSNKQQATS
jgi:adenylate cyclase class 2